MALSDAAKIARRERAIRRMKSIPAAAKQRLKEQLAANAADLVRLARARAPVDSGDLRDSIRHEDVSDETRIAQRVVVGDEKTVTRNETGFAFSYPRGVEFGTEDTPAQPFLFPSYRQRRKAYRRSMNAAIKKGVDDALKR